MNITCKDLLTSIDHFEVIGDIDNVSFKQISTDSRTIQEGELFFPLTGPNFDGHNFIAAALLKSRNIALCDRTKIENVTEKLEQLLTENNIDVKDFKYVLIVVENVELALEQVTAYIRSLTKAKLISITGSTGKTTTREMLYTIFSTKYEVLKAEGNINTLWGNASVLMNWTGQEFIIFETGLDRKGEIGWQNRGLIPDIGCIINVGTVHAEPLGGVENIFIGKKEMADYLYSKGKPVVLNIDDKRLASIKKNYGDLAISVGSEKEAEYRCEQVELDEKGIRFKLMNKETYYDVQIPIYGIDYVYNALISIVIANYFGFSIEQCIQALGQYHGYKYRFEINEVNEYLTLINDSYNANPDSMKMSINTFAKIWGEKYHTVAFLGHMAELGEVEKEEHRKLGELIKEKNFDEVFYTGRYYEFVNAGEYLADFEEIKKKFNAICDNAKKNKIKTAILVKGSHSVGLHRLFE